MTHKRRGSWQDDTFPFGFKPIKTRNILAALKSAYLDDSGFSGMIDTSGLDKGIYTIWRSIQNKKGDTSFVRTDKTIQL